MASYIPKPLRILNIIGLPLHNGNLRPILPLKFQHENISIVLLNIRHTLLSTNIVYSLIIVYNINIMNRDKLNEFIGFIICLVVVIGVCQYTGALKNIGDPSSFISKAIDSTGIRVNSGNYSNGSRKSSKIKNYKTQILKDSIIETSKKQGIWNNIFSSNKKVIFYLYDGNDDFHNQIDRYVSAGMLSRNYNIVALSSNSFRKVRLGTTGPGKICNSFAECNEQRLASVHYTEMVSLLEWCGKSMCIINPAKKEYVYLRTRNAADAKKMIQALKNW